MSNIIAVHFDINDSKYNTSTKRLNFIRNKLNVDQSKKAHKTKTQIKYHIKEANPKQKHFTKKIDNVNVIFEGKKGGSVINALRQLIFGLDQFNYASKATLEKYSNQNINSIQIARTPLNKKLEDSINALSLGRFKELTSKKYEVLYHLSLILFLESGEQLIYEKNESVEIIELRSSTSIKDTTDFFDIDLLEPLMLATFVNNALEGMGSKFFTYKSLLNNCQNFIRVSLSSSGLLTEDADEFIYQDMSEIRENINESHPYFEKLLDAITELGSRQTILMGKGKTEHDALQKHLTKHSKIIHKIILDGKFKSI